MNSVPTMNPNGGAGYRRTLRQMPSDNGLLEQIVSADNIRSAWKQVRSNKGAPGIDGISVDEFPNTCRECRPEIRSSLLEGSFKPSPVLRVEIPKPDGSSRPPGSSTVLDRLIQQAAAQITGPIFDSGFSESSCGFRPGRSAHDGVRQVKQ